MAKQTTIFSCQNCGAQSPKWLGKCPDCNQWSTYVEETFGGGAETRPGFSSVVSSSAKSSRSSAAVSKKLSDISADTSERSLVGIEELDRVLGGGLVKGSVTLVGGDPGIGKSTIVMQALGKLADRQNGSGALLYASGEESAPQIKMRAERLGLGLSKILVVTENNLENLLGELDRVKPAIVIIDSIQTIYSAKIQSAPGTVSQVRESAGALLYWAKGNGSALMLVGHVTKDGALAGPKVLEHMVDTVLYFEGERGHPFRILRAVKNRFGSTNEIGVFEMTGAGLKEVPNPSGLFLAERPEGAAGSVVVASLEGSRPVLVELQALVASSGFAQPRRTAIGLDSGRVALLVAVLEKVVGLTLHDQDIFLNVAGGLKVLEPAADLGVIASIASSFRNRPVDSKLLMLGEVGLTGEVRAVSGIEMRLAEAAKMGFTKVVVPKSNTKVRAPKGLEVTGITSVSECLDLI